MPKNTKKGSNASSNAPQGKTAAKWLAAGWSALMFAYGVFTITTQHFHGRTTKLGGTAVSADGTPAIIMGVGIIVFGLLPMALWAKSGRKAGIWAVTCLFVGLALFIVAPLFPH